MPHWGGFPKLGVPPKIDVIFMGKSDVPLFQETSIYRIQVVSPDHVRKTSDEGLRIPSKAIPGNRTANDQGAPTKSQSDVSHKGCLGTGNPSQSYGTGVLEFLRVEQEKKDSEASSGHSKHT